MDYPINPDYYLVHGRVGDCEDAAVAVVSVLQAKGYEAKVVIGYLHKALHAWVKVKIDNEWYIGDMDTMRKDNTFIYVFVKDIIKNRYEVIAEAC